MRMSSKVVKSTSLRMATSGTATTLLLLISPMWRGVAWSTHLWPRLASPWTQVVVGIKEASRHLVRTQWLVQVHIHTEEVLSYFLFSQLLVCSNVVCKSWLLIWEKSSVLLFPSAVEAGTRAIVTSQFYKDSCRALFDRCWSDTTLGRDREMDAGRSGAGGCQIRPAPFTRVAHT